MRPIYDVLAFLYEPTLWALVVFHVAMGVIGLTQPMKLRAVLQRFSTKRPIRILGVALMVIGAMLFAAADRSTMPLVAKVLAVAFFIDGGVRLVIPTVSVVYTEWMMSWPPAGLRFLALVALCLAYFFYLAAQTPPVTVEPVVEGLLSRGWCA